MNIYDIAKKANVSIATVSRVINQKGNVSDKTKKKVEEVILELGYTPSMFARGLSGSTTGLIGLVTTDVQDIYYANAINTIEQFLRKNGYDILLCNTGNNLYDKKKYLELLLSKGIEGIIVIGSAFKEKDNNSHILKASLKMPVVMLNATIDSPNISCIVCNDKNGMIQLCSHVKNNHKDKKPIFIYDKDTLSTQNKIQGFLEIFPNSKTYKSELGYKGGYMATLDLLSKNYKALIFSEDLLACGAIMYANENNITLPNDLVITGYNASLFSRIATPVLTSVNSRVEDLSITAANAMLNMLKGEKSKNIIIEPTLAIGKSS